MDITELRKYRLQLDSYPFFNNENRGISLFDLILSFIGAWILNHFFHLSNKLNGKENTYYLLVIPFGILIHYLVSIYENIDQFTFLNKKLFSSQFNIYKVIIFIVLYIILLKN